MDQITRRQFGLGLLGLVGGAAISRTGDAGKPSIVGGVKVGVQSYSFRKFSIDQMVDAMKSVGLGYVELWDGHLNPTKATEADFKAVRTRLNNSGIQVGAYCVNFPVDASDDYLDRAFNGALLLGTEVMTSSVKKPIVPRLDQWCRKYRIKLGLHNHWFGEPWYKGDRNQEFEKPQDFLEALGAASGYLSINLDIGHFYAAGFDPVAFFREHHDRIVSLHLKDRDRDALHTNRRFGQGATPIIEVMQLAGKYKFEYVANIEYEPEPDNPTDGVREAFDYLKTKLGVVAARPPAPRRGR